MSWPIDARWETRLSGNTVVKAAWADASDDAITGVIGGSRTITRLTVDGLGGHASGLASSGSIYAAGNVEVAGNAIAGASVFAGVNVVASGSISAGTSMQAARFLGAVTATTVTPGGAAGSGSSTSGSSLSDGCGFLSVNARLPGAPGVVATINFSSNYASGFPRAIVLTPANEQAARSASGGGASLGLFVRRASSGFDLVNESLVALASGQTFQWNYVIVG